MQNIGRMDIIKSTQKLVDQFGAILLAHLNTVSFFEDLFQIRLEVFHYDENVAKLIIGNDII